MRSIKHEVPNVDAAWAAVRLGTTIDVRQVGGTVNLQEGWAAGAWVGDVQIVRVDHASERGTRMSRVTVFGEDGALIVFGWASFTEADVRDVIVNALRRQLGMANRDSPSMIFWDVRGIGISFE